MSNVHIVNHTHWDREWYFTTADSIVLSDDVFTKVLDELDKHKDAKFCLDGQSSILDEYIELRPERLEQVKRLIAEKKLEIGPWYTQTDAFFVDAESIIKNLTIGIRDSSKYGDYMKVGYLPDTFGLNVQMPTIMKNVNIDNIIFRRGINFGKHVKGPYFTWQGLGNKEVYGINLVDSYGAASFLTDDPKYLEDKLIPRVNNVKNKTSIDQILIPAGGDQLDIIENLPGKIESINEQTDDTYFISSYEEFIDAIKNYDNLETYRGEFREPTKDRVHKTIGSVRYDIKRTNFIIEQKLLRRVEPLMAVARANGIEISNEILVIAWKKILEGHAHDSMGGCVSDAVAEDILHRMKEADELVDGVENMIIKRISEKIDLQVDEILVFNTLPIDYEGYKIIEFMSPSKEVILKGLEDSTIIEAKYYEGKDNLLIETQEGNKYINEDPYYKLKVLTKISLPSMGYKRIKFEENKKQLDFLEKEKDNFIENNLYKISYENEEIILETKDGKKLKNFIEFEDTGNAGDTYDYSPLSRDEPKILKLLLKDIKKSNNLEVMSLEGKFKLPLNLDSRLNNNENGILKISLDISLLSDSELIDINCKVDNQILSHRLRAKINTGINAEDTIASVPFGYIRREVLNGEPSNWEEDYVEMPIDIEPYDKSVAVETEEYNITAFSKGMKEYQFIEDSLYLTLFSSTGQLGKPNLKYRPGRASGDTTKKGHVMIPTPLAELQGVNEFEFALYLGDGKFDEYKAAKLWEEYNNQNINYQNQTLNKFIYRLDNKIQPREDEKSNKSEFSLLSLDSKVIFSSFSPSLYDDNSFVIRLQNPTKEEIKVNGLQSDYIKKWEKINYIEEIEEEQNLVIEPYDTLTLKLWL